MKTKAAILSELNKPLIVTEVEVPKLKEGQILVKIRASGICRAQYNETIGLKGHDKFLPHLLGHEASGEVIEVGCEVKKVKSGDFVVLTWIKGKGREGISSQYKFGNKVVNAGAVTTFQEYSVVSENRVVKIPAGIPAIIAALLGCAIPTGCGIVDKTLAVKRGSTLAVFGVGGVGGSAILGAKLSGCRKIIAVDISRDKLQFAKFLGATHTVDFRTRKASSTILSDLDYAIEASGVKEAMEAAFESLYDQGKLVIAGNLKKGEKISITPFDLIKGKRILGTWGGEAKPDEDIPYYAKQYLMGKLPIEKLVTRKFRLEQINDALELMGKNKVLGRTVIEF